jgi:RHS repeat-associated protein
VTGFRHQIHGPTGPVALYTRRSSGTADTYYLHRDHLGSPELVTNAAGTQIVKLSFGAFGERRGSNWSGTPSTPDWTAIGNTTRDGFTDHETLDNVGLIHMNGRVYDPRIGRFLSPDPIIMVGLSQDVNRYAYGWNNPLRVVDPDGLKENTLTFFEGGSVQFPGITISGAHDQSALLDFNTFHDATLIGSGLCMIVGGGYSFFLPDGTLDESLQPGPEEVRVTATRLRTSRSRKSRCSRTHRREHLLGLGSSGVITDIVGVQTMKRSFGGGRLVVARFSRAGPAGSRGWPARFRRGCS